MVKADKGFVVGHGANGFSMLLIKGTFESDRPVGSDGRNYPSITRIEKFDSAKPEHAEFIPFRDYALRNK